jgi:hypothetical protein
VDSAAKRLLDLASGKEPVSVGWQLIVAQYQTSLAWSRPLGEVADGGGSSVAMSSIIA